MECNEIEVTKRNSNPAFFGGFRFSDNDYSLDSATLHRGYWLATIVNM
jgi:hypothetical protein